MERFVDKFEHDRRLSRRHNFRTDLRIRVRRSNAGELRAESKNLSQRGVFFATDLELSKGAALDLVVEMPEQITGVPAAQWLCTGHVVRVEKINPRSGKQGVGVQFDCYEVSRSKPADVAIGTVVPVRMLRDLAPNGDRILPWKNAQLLWTMNQRHAN